MNAGKSLAESIEEATTAYYRDGGGSETGIAADEKLVEAIISEKTPERFMRSLLDSKILRAGASAADVAALRSGLDGLLGHGVAGTENLKKSLDMRERSTRH